MRRGCWASSDSDLDKEKELQEAGDAREVNVSGEMMNSFNNSQNRSQNNSTSQNGHKDAIAQSIVAS